MTEPKVWCSHISSGPYVQDSWRYGDGASGSIVMIMSNEMFCKYCGAKRPEAKKKLWELFKKEKAYAWADSDYNEFASIALQEFERIINERPSFDSIDGRLISRNGLKAKLKELQ